MAAALLIAASLTLGACDFGGGDSEPEPAAGSTASSAAEPMHLDVLVFNVEYGGGPATDRVIRRVNADVVGVLESYNRLPEIARRTRATRTTTSRCRSSRSTRSSSRPEAAASTP